MASTKLLMLLRIIKSQSGWISHAFIKVLAVLPRQDRRGALEE